MHSAVCGCEKLVEIDLPEGLQRLEEHAFAYCSMKTINIPPNVETIESSAFFWCHSLTDIAFPEGLREIEEAAFSRCTSLVSVNLPSTLIVIGKEAFENCSKLNEIHTHDTIVTIGRGAFTGCNFTKFRMPPMSNVDIGMFGTLKGNSIKYCLISLELPENVTHITDEDEYYSALNVRNIALPSECVIDSDTLHHCTDLALAFDVDTDDDDDTTTIIKALRQRFDDLPIHKICYYQSYHDTETTIQNLKREINPWTSKIPGQLNTTGKEQDCLGMTPLHILACSTKPTIEMYRLLIEKYPETLIMRDKWGDVPLLYAFWCNAPTEVIDLLVESYKLLHPDYEFDWSGMLLSSAKRDVPLANTQNLFNTQHKISPDYNYNMQQVVIELAASNATHASLRKPYTSIETFKYLLRASITKRLDLLSVSKWRVDLENRITALPDEVNYRDEKVKNREGDIKGLYDKLATYESIKEATSVLELTLWKAKNDDRNRRARVTGEDISYKEQCRVNCGADIVIRNVLPYLIPKPVFRKTKF